jgi:uncharacterized membrane protein YuzA (DUF378 family)
MKALHTVSFILVIIGGLNWLLVGLAKWDIGSLLGGMDSILSRIVYVLVGVSAVYLIATHKKTCKDCGACGSCATCSAETPKM